MSTIAWVAWVLLVMVTGLTTTNPLYLAIVFLCVVLTGILAPKTETAVAGFRALLVFGLTLFAFSMAITIVNGSYGEHVLFTVPGPDFPRWMGGLALGGPVTAEGLTWSAIRGLTILAILLAFATFNGAVSPHRVLRLTPAALFHAGLVVTIGLTLLPSSIEDVRRIREMQALRGRRTGLRQLPALVVPAVLGGLERSMRLAEAMESRGYASTPATPQWARALGVAGVPALLASAGLWFYYADEWRPLAGGLGIAGVGSLVAWGLISARLRQTTRLRREPVPVVERVAASASFLLAGLLFANAMGGWVDLGYDVFADFGWPPFEPVGGIIALASGWPAVRLAFAPRPRAARAPAADAVPAS